MEIPAVVRTKSIFLDGYEFKFKSVLSKDLRYRCKCRVKCKVQALVPPIMIQMIQETEQLDLTADETKNKSNAFPFKSLTSTNCIV
jgi:hypothetical protein